MSDEQQLDEVLEILRINVPESPNQSVVRENFLTEVQSMHAKQYNSMHPAISRQHAQPKQNRRGVLIVGIFTLVMLMVSVVVAYQAFDFFNQSANDQQAMPIRFGSGRRIVNTPKTIAEVAQMADFEIVVPEFIPSAYQFGGAFYWDTEESITIHYQCGTFRELILSQSPMTAMEASNLSQLEVGASATIDVVAIGDSVGQYVRGTWIVSESNMNRLAATAMPGTPIPAQSMWENTSELQRLFWYSDGILYLLSNIGSRIDVGTAGECAVDKEDYVKIARSLIVINNSQRE